MEAPTQKRTPSRCREWERARRNKFNDAITKLGEVVKAINKTNFPDADADDAQCPKVEIIQKAIVCLTNCGQQITHLKADILAVKVQLETTKPKDKSIKDASTQVYYGLSKKRKDGKYVKLLMLKKSKTKSNKNIVQNKNKPQLDSIRKLPKLLPRGGTSEKKGPENTIVVLPAAPYIFPSRPLLFPAVPPAIVLVDQNMQPLSKGPLLNRNNGDITKTTMVNILPISAYSHPLSAVKNKKQNVKLKSYISKKLNQKTKPTGNTAKEPLKVSESKTPTVVTKQNKTPENSNKENDESNKVVPNKEKKMETDKNTIKNATQSIKEVDKIQKEETITVNKINSDVLDINICKSKENEVPNVIDKPKSPETVTKELPINVVTTCTAQNTDTVKCLIENKTMKSSASKENVTDSKLKQNKLPNILPLDTPLCDNVVDTGNARLELAEEFLATSPTAAFLMSFPLVSGNRADSPADENSHSTTPANPKESQRRTEIAPPPVTYFEKPTNDIKTKSANKLSDPCNTTSKENEQQKCVTNVVTKESNNNITITKPSNTAPLPSISSENPFLNLPMPSLISTNCTLADTNFGLEFDCNISKSIPSQSSSYVSSNNFFYKSDPFGTVKNSIYSTSSITSGHEFNSLGLYPCAMEKYASKNKTDYSSVDDNLMKIGSSRLTYDIDLGWSHKGLDFVNCTTTTTTNTFNKDTILTSNATPYTTSYNPFNPDFHVPLVPSKKDNSNKVPSSSLADTITSFYSQPTNLWSEDVPFYTNNNISKALTSKNQNYPALDNSQTNTNTKLNINKHYETKMTEAVADGVPGIKDSNTVEKYTKKSPNKMHINWMTSEIRSVQNNCNPVLPHPEIKDTHKSYNNSDHSVKKHDHNEGNYFPISMHNFPTQPVQEEFPVWPASTRPLGTTEISIDPPPINLPTLVGDLALGPHEKNKKADLTNRTATQTDIQNCGNFLSVTQLMNRSTDNMQSRFQVPNIEPSKSIPAKQHTNNFANETHRKSMMNLENHMPQPCYVFNDLKVVNSYDNMAQFTQPKTKLNSKAEKSSKSHKNNYSTEALLRGANCTQKIHDTNSTKFMMPSQKYPDYSNTQDSGVAQVSHFPPIIDYSDNGYTSQQFSGTTLYNTTTNTISNSFYSNFMPGSSNLMPSNYASAPFTGDFIDYNQTAECNYANHKYEELKMRNNTAMFQTEKVPTNYKSSRRESTKHKLECSKKESSKKYQSKKAKMNNEIEDWNDSSHLIWQNKMSSKKHTNLMSEELPFPNYVGNQMPAQYQSDFFNSHLMPTNMQSMGHNVDRSLAGLPVTSRANFNLSTIFPEITMKVQ
ncbi:unnamed protein product [Arctia plantaginis]|uniref:BHLH domain-containing protein n=1 Tax=Arctia plantaginis TaxID=874455 RepID=A0A8S0ZVY9_ARCPL|nr:unnamed protein product [Arctia plantaginis]